MPKVLGWFDIPPELEWERESVAFLYDSQQGPGFYSFPMTGLVPYNDPDIKELESAPSPLWVAYLDPKGSIGKPDSKGDKTYVLTLPNSFDEYLASLPYDHRKEMRYVLRKNVDVEIIENRKEDIDLVWDDHIKAVRERSIKEGEEPFSEHAVELLQTLFRSSLVHTLSFRIGGKLYGVNISFRRAKTVYDSMCIRVHGEEVKSRGLGNYAILKNIEYAIRDGYAEYDMLAGEWGYKSKFGAKPREMKHYVKCTAAFANHYGIPLQDVSVLLGA